jgi:hypothetical protein
VNVTGTCPLVVVATDSPDKKNAMRFIDVRGITDRPSGESRDCTFYITADQRLTFVPGVDSNIGSVGHLGVSAFQGLFGRVELGVGGVSRSEEFTIPARGKTIHVGADTVRCQIVFDPDRANMLPSGSLDPDFEIAVRIQRSAGFELNGAVTTADVFPDVVRNEYVFARGGPQRFQVPNFSEDVQLFYPAPQLFLLKWYDPFGFFIATAQFSAIDYVDRPSPIPLNAASVELVPIPPFETATASVTLLRVNPLLVWRRQS